MIYLIVYWIGAMIYWDKFVLGVMYVCLDPLFPLPPFVHLSNCNLPNCKTITEDYWIATPLETYHSWINIFFIGPIVLAFILFVMRTMMLLLKHKTKLIWS